MKHFMKHFMKYSKDIVSPLNDYAFVEIFGNQKNIGNTRAFLKTLLDIPETEYDKLTVVSPNLGRFFKKGKKGIVDLKLKTKSDKIIHIELQVEKKIHFRNRILYYAARLIGDQLRWGDDYGKLHQVISIVICDHELLEEEGSYINEYKLRNKENRAFTNLLKVVILELPKLPDADDSAIWPWLKFMKCKKMEEYEMLARKYPQLEKPIFCAKEMSLLEKWRDLRFHKNLQKVDEKYMRMQWEMDARAKGHAEGKAEGHTEGHAEGLEKGEQKRGRAIAKNLLAEGSTPEFVQKMTGLDLKTIQELTTEQR